MDVDEYYVSKYYEMDPETDILIPNGRELQDDMLVLAANPDFRVIPTMIAQHDEYWRPRVLEKYTKPSGPEGSPRKYRGQLREGSDMEAIREALRWNRWCTVSHLEIRAYNFMNDHVHFVGTYEDGSQFKLFADITEPWLRRIGRT